MDKKKVSSLKASKVVLIVLLAILVLAAVLYGGIRLLCFLGNYLYENYFFDIDYETTDVAQYGKFEFLSDEDYQEYILPVFPESIQPEFEDVIYDYRAYAPWGHGYKAYLEFTIRDPEKFDTFVQSTTQGLEKGIFHFDNAYEEYVLFDEDTGWVYDHIGLDDPYEPEDMGLYYTVDSALIVKVLVDRSQQRLIYIYIDVSDCAFTTKDLDPYFSRFQIDPIEYEAYTNANVSFSMPIDKPEKTFEEKVAEVLEKLKPSNVFKVFIDTFGWEDMYAVRHDYLDR